jgi:hypothetical protein
MDGHSNSEFLIFLVIFPFSNLSRFRDFGDDLDGDISCVIVSIFSVLASIDIGLSVAVDSPTVGIAICEHGRHELLGRLTSDDRGFTVVVDVVNADDDDDDDDDEDDADDAATGDDNGSPGVFFLIADL